MSGHQYSSIHDPTMFLHSGPLVVYDLTVRARLGNAIGYFLGGYISFFFALIMLRKQQKGRQKLSFRPFKSKKLNIIFGIVLIMVVISVFLYIIWIIKSAPIIETRFEGFLQR